ncbi:TetR/AcrR family transcriptional regulator [Variovorax dokdonensis]|uniref:TetR/AcrR family transcriptional regulator n=1 Tax=Variovorax dokdonensis TaxID=344883 RepID=A0ABT7NBB3_9BURK|nr:TetR/AcrR family transcriptional regulator [Variovorax dokdonensis]MDM0045216.1 TetR/AcrR family transcriptional regulator [Variovorax dokdonensis]
MPKTASASVSTLEGLPARARILHTAHALFYRDGVRATGIDRVIAESGVTKVTFYRHFPSKNELVLAYLDHRHEHWMQWLHSALERNGSARKGIRALVPALAEWLGDEEFRGCAFLNSVSELGGALPEVCAVSRNHKADMAAAIAGLLPASRQRAKQAAAIALAVDGAIVQAQFGETPEAAVKALGTIIDAVCGER